MASYPDPRLTALSRYSHQEICATIDQWHETEARFNALIQQLPDNFPLWDEINWLEPVSWREIGNQRHSAGSAEDYPVRKWQVLIRKHNRLSSRIEAILRGA